MPVQHRLSVGQELPGALRLQRDSSEELWARNRTAGEPREKACPMAPILYIRVISPVMHRHSFPCLEPPHSSVHIVLSRIKLLDHSDLPQEKLGWTCHSTGKEDLLSVMGEVLPRSSCRASFWLR